MASKPSFKRNDDNNIVMNFPQAVAHSRLPNWQIVPKFGRNPSVGTTSEDIWSVGGVRVDPPTAAVVSIASTDAADTLLGTGCRVVQLFGVDANYIFIEDVVELDGTTPVTSTKLFLRVNTALVYSAGSTFGNEGGITGSIGGNAQFIISPPSPGLTHGRGVAQGVHFTVPMGFTAYVEQVETWVGKGQGIQVEMYIKDFVRNAWYSPGQIDVYQVPVPVEVFSTIVLPQRSEFKFVARSDAGSIDVNMFATILLGLNV